LYLSKETNTFSISILVIFVNLFYTKVVYFEPIVFLKNIKILSKNYKSPINTFIFFRYKSMYRNFIKTRHNLFYRQTSRKRLNYKSFSSFSSFKLHIIIDFFYKVCEIFFNYKFCQKKSNQLSMLTPLLLYHIKHYSC